MPSARRAYNTLYEGEHLDTIAFPLGGIGAGMLCLEGTGTLSHVSLRNEPDFIRRPGLFSALYIKGSEHRARVLEGPVPARKISATTGLEESSGLPHFASTTFLAKFPFADIRLEHPDVPLEVTLTGWSPFIPGDADNSSLPAAALEFTFRNTQARQVDGVYYFLALNMIKTATHDCSVQPVNGGFVLNQAGTEEKPWEDEHFCARVDDPEAKTDAALFRGEWYDTPETIWKQICRGECIARPPHSDGKSSSGGALSVPFSLRESEQKTIRLMLCWYVPTSSLRVGAQGHEVPTSETCCEANIHSTTGVPTHKPWYAGRFGSINELADYWCDNYDTLRRESAAFRDCFYDTTLPPEIVEAVAANLPIIKSPTLLRQTDGRLWTWEGSTQSKGCCYGSCTHVLNYAQALAHLFPDLERTFRQTEFNENQNEDGHQDHRAYLPIRPTAHAIYSAADGQLGGIVKIYRDWRISGDTEWLKALWPKVEAGLNYCIRTWDPDHEGVLTEPQHVTYDIKFWGPNGMCSSIYLAALKAATVMATALGKDCTLYRELLDKGCSYLEEKLFNGEYFEQEVRWKGLGPEDAFAEYTPEALELLETEGPKYQYATGCLADGILGAFMAAAAGLEPFLDSEKTRSHLLAVKRYNAIDDLSDYPWRSRPDFALGKEAGLIMCTWPRGGEPSLPMIYSGHVWTGTEYHVAAHLIMSGCVEQGLEIVRAARSRYDGRVRNPFAELECGHWYARAMSSYALLQALSGARYDAVEKKLHLQPAVNGDFRSFLATATGFGIVGVKNGEPFLEVKQGIIESDEIAYTPNARAAKGNRTSGESQT